MLIKDDQNQYFYIDLDPTFVDYDYKEEQTFKLDIVDSETFKPAVNKFSQILDTGQHLNLNTNFKIGFDNEKPIYSGSDKNLHYLATFNGLFIAGSKTNIPYQHLGNGYVKYNQKIYYFSNELPQVDYNTFQTFEYKSGERVLGVGSYAKDKNNVYYKSYILENADPDTFNIVDNAKYPFYEYAFDNNNKYRNGKILDEESEYLLRPFLESFKNRVN